MQEGRPSCMKPVQNKPNKWGEDRLLQRILHRSGLYYRSADLFYQQLWKQRLANIGLRVTSVERLEHHPVWDIRFYADLAAQTYLLVSKAVPKKCGGAQDLLSSQLRSEIRKIAKDLGAPIKADC